MRAGGGKQKGSAFERDVCKKLSEWITYGKRTDVFWRTAMSGGRATVASKRGIDVRQAGDICAVAPEGFGFADRYYVECKFYKDLGIESFLFKNKGTLAGFWAKAIKESVKLKKRPMLIAKQNGLPPFVMMTEPCDYYPFITMPNISCSFIWFKEFLKIIPENFGD